MILLGCLLAFGAAVAPRVILVLAWIFSDRWARVWQGDIILPLLGIIFLPYTTIMYMLVVVVGPAGNTSIEGFGWLWVLLGLLLDLMKWGQIITNRKAGQEYAAQYYPEGAPGASTVKSMSPSSSYAPAATSAAQPDPGSESPPDEGGSTGSGGSGSS